MIPLSLAEIAAVVGGTVEGDGAVTVTAPTVLDGRQAEPGALIDERQPGCCTLVLHRFPPLRAHSPGGGRPEAVPAAKTTRRLDAESASRPHAP